jgi:hypothetical protein
LQFYDKQMSEVVFKVLANAINASAWCLLVNHYLRRRWCHERILAIKKISGRCYLPDLLWRRRHLFVKQFWKQASFLLLFKPP